MTTTLIKTNNSLILVSDEIIKGGDTWRHPNGAIFPYTKTYLKVFLILQKSGAYKVLSQSPKLSKEVADEIGWIDVEKLVTEDSVKIICDRNGNPDKTLLAFGIQCFQKANELNQKKYTEGYIKLAYRRGWQNRENAKNGDAPYYHNDSSWGEDGLKEHLQSLSKSKWQVEAEEIDGVWNVNKTIK